MERLNEIFTRTCCREFDSQKEITKEQIELILRAGQAAPSAKNRQPYFFIAVIDKKIRKEISDAAVKGRKKQFAHLSQEEFEKTEKGQNGSNDRSIFSASAAILVLRNSDPSYTEANSQSVSLNIKEEQGVATAAYSMVLQAEKLGISSGWICSSLYMEQELEEIFTKNNINWNNNWKPRLIIPLGYCVEKPNKPERKSLEEISLII